MKVESGVTRQVDIASTKANKNTGAEKAIESAEAKINDGGSANVSISEKAQMIAKAKELATPDMDSIREDKVAHFQKLIDAGEYQVDAASVADRLVDDHLIG